MVSNQILDDTVLIRTPHGQHAVLDDVQIGEPAARLLRMVNGYTSLRDLTACLDLGQDWNSVARSLLERNLVAQEPVRI